MDTFTTLLTFTYPSEAYVLKGLLESEGIRCFLKDELNVQMYSLNSNAYGGVKLQVATSDLLKAQELIKENGYNLPDYANETSIWKKFDSFTNKIEWIKEFDPVYRFLIIAAIVIFLIAIIALKISE